MPWVCSFYNPSFYCCRMYYVLYQFFFSTMRYMNNVSSFNSFSFYFWKVDPLSRHTQILFTWRSLNYYTIQCIFCSLHVTRICRRNDNNNRHTMEYHVGLSVSTWHLIPISPLSMGFEPTYHVLPKDALQIHYQAIAISIQCLWAHHKLTSNSLILFRKYVRYYPSVVEPPMADSRTRPNSLGSIFHCDPVLNRCRIPSRTFLNEIIGRLIVSFGFSGGSSGSISFHSIIHLESF